MTDQPPSGYGPPGYPPPDPTNPYQAPAPPAPHPYPYQPYGQPGWPTQMPSGAPKALGILSIVFSVLTFIFAGFLSVAGIAVVIDGSYDVEDPPLLATVLFVALGAIPLFIIGLGQLRYRRWAHRATRIWSVLAIVGIVAGCVWAAIAIPDVGLKGGFIVFFAFVFLPYPIIQLSFMASSRITAAMDR